MTNKSSKKEETIIQEIKEQKIDNKNKKIYLLVIQFFLSVITLGFVIAFMFNKDLMAYLQISLALTLIVIGINNIVVYKRKLLPVVYFLMGASLIALAVLTILGV